MNARKAWKLSAAGAAAVAIAAAGIAAATASSAQSGPPSSTATGPNTTSAPYLLPVAPGVEITSLLTVNDAASADNAYELVGIPDGLGTLEDGKNIVALMNHELRTNQGIVRRHGAKGAYVSKMTIDPRTNRIIAGEDFINPGVQFWNYATGTYSTSPSPAWTIDGVTAPAQLAEFGRFCSGFLSEPGQLLNATSGLGYDGQVYFANEENGDEGRAFGVTTDGDAVQLPRLGLFSWENTIVAPSRSDTTLVMGNEDTAHGQIWAYIGTKQSDGSPMDKAGLTNGANFVLDVIDQTVATDAQFRAKFGKGTPVPVTTNEVDWRLGGVPQNAVAAQVGLTLNRIEDGAFDPSNRNDFYFVTTEGGVGAIVSTDPALPGVGNGRDGGGLWRLRFADVDNPQLGATLELLLDGSEAIGLNKPDNMTIDHRGNLLLQEDPGNNVHLARIVAYRISDGATATVAQFDASRFGRDAAVANGPAFLTADEESSGIVPTTKQLGPNTFLLDAQVHTAKGLPAGTGAGTIEEFVENGQLMVMRVVDWNKVYKD